MNYPNRFPAQSQPNTLAMQVKDTKVLATGQSASIFAAFFGITLAIVVGSALLSE